jgi:Flp pilus assembly pilin Flp
MLAFLQDPSSEYGEESASVAAITGLVLLVIIAVMAIFRTALIGAFNRIAALLGF